MTRIVFEYTPRRPGLSLEYAYRPLSEQELLSDYNNHPCAVCGAVVAIDLLPEAPQMEVGSIIFKTFSKPCHCGYVNEVFVVLNNYLSQVEAGIPKAEEAIARSREEGLLLDPFLEESLTDSSVALHQGNLEQALVINRQLSDRFPQVILPFYNLGVIYSQQQRYRESLAAYEAALKLDPQHSASLGNKARVLMQLDQLREAGETYEQWRAVNSEETVVLAEEKGMFGTVRIIDQPEKRFLCIDEQVQGDARKQPGANEWEANCRFGPGPLSDSYLGAASLLVGCQMPEASGLVLGLGCGVGLTTNLACFPELRLTVVEIDPVVIRLCLTFFPLVQHYVDAGRLEIVRADATDFLSSNRRQFDFIQCDAYQGYNELPAEFASAEFIELMKQTAPLLFVNILSQLNAPHLHRVLAAFDAAGKPLSTLYPGAPLAEIETKVRNWFGFSQEATIPEGFFPFANLSTNSIAANSAKAIEEVRRHFAALQNNPVARDRLLPYIEQFNLEI